MKDWLALSKEQRKQILTRASENLGISTQIIEKDLWVSAVLVVLFQGTYKDELVFKGGTSLSKAWDLLNRFSEDIDISFSHTFFAPEGISTNSQLKRLRKDARAFFKEGFWQTLQQELAANCGTEDAFKLSTQEAESSDQDPTIINVYYTSDVEGIGDGPLRKDQVQLEIGVRSAQEPAAPRDLTSMLFNATKENYGLGRFQVNAILPVRTFLEKCFLLHEEFSKHEPATGIRAERLSRHFYDINVLMNSSHIKYNQSLEELFREIASHRQKFSKVSGIDYDNITLASLQLLPPEAVRSAWESDYRKACESLIQGEPPTFGEILMQLEELQQRFTDLAPES